MAGRLKQLAKQIPILPSLYRELRNRWDSLQLKSKTAEQVFTDIYINNSWGGKDSVSGQGSDIFQTRIIAREIPLIFKAYGISTLLDIPCGDFFWMNTVDMKGVEYTGADIVSDLINNNTARYARNNVRFLKMDIIKSQLPKVDLIFCRDCLVHLSFEDIICALNNVCNSRSAYILTTTFTEETTNRNIATGQWRTLNLERAPFNLPKPILTINEGCTEYEGDFKDKALGLWKISDIQKSLAPKDGDRS